MPAKPPLYKEFLVGLMVGGLFGPLIGWFIGTFATFFALAAMDTSNVRSMRGSAFIGGLTQGLTFLKNPWLAALLGTIMGWFCGYLILTNWSPTFGSLIYVVMVCMVVGGVTGSASVSARPKWL